MASRLGNPFRFGSIELMLGRAVSAPRDKRNEITGYCRPPEKASISLQLCRISINSFREVNSA